MTTATGAQTGANGAQTTADTTPAAPDTDTAGPADAAASAQPTADPLDELDEPDTEPDDTEPEPDTFSREYVSELRRESREHRLRARDAETRADELGRALWTERVAALGLLADPADLPYDADALHDADEIRARADALLAERPHLRTRRITSRAGQGEGNGADAVSITGIMRARA